jgi:hypothetical protein
LPLLLRFSVLLATLFVHCVLACTSPVAVHAWSSILAEDGSCGVGQGTTEVDVEVGRICLDLEELVVGHHSRCDGLPLLAVDTKHGPPHRRRDGRGVGLARTSPTLLTGGRKATHVRCVLRSRSLTWQWSIHDPAYLSSFTRCRTPHQAWLRRGATVADLRQFSMQDPGFGVPRMHLPSTRVNKGIRKGRAFDTPARWSSYRPLTAPLLADR